MSLFLGAVAGFVVGLAYLIAYWVVAPGSLDPDHPAITYADQYSLHPLFLLRFPQVLA
jgi:hypothetical protein